MQVALQPAPFGIPGLDDPGPGGTDLLELGLHLGLQPGVIQGHARRCRRQPDQLRLKLQAFVVNQDGPRGPRNYIGATARPGSGWATSTA